ncbi:MAG: ribonuclease HII [Pseudomonadota bacterium]
MPPNLAIESQYGDKIIAGVDEAGRGPLAGPVCAAAVIIDPCCIIECIDDSKKLSEQKRERLYEEITTRYKWGVGYASVEEINAVNILEATKLACIRAISALPTSPEVVLIDGNMKFSNPSYVSIIRGDQLSISIAAASIIAKVSRDRLMQDLDLSYPEYQWSRNKGYGTKLHLEALRLYGKTEHHRNFNFS